MSKITVTKVFNLDENFIFPICHKCKTELTPFTVSDDEINNLSEETVELLLASQLLQLHEVDYNKHLIYLCKTCLKWTKTC